MFQDGLYLFNKGTMCPGTRLVTLFSSLLEDPLREQLCYFNNDILEVKYRLADNFVGHVISLYGKATCQQARTNVYTYFVSFLVSTTHWRNSERHLFPGRDQRKHGSGQQNHRDNRWCVVSDCQPWQVSDSCQRGDWVCRQVHFQGDYHKFLLNLFLNPKADFPSEQGETKNVSLKGPLFIL